MGLDMYLVKKHYVNYSNNEGTISLGQHFKTPSIIEIDLSKVSTICIEAAYWRKANQIHNWFVQNVQDGKDDCEEYEVTYEKLMELKNTCLLAIETKNPNLLPPTEGFFFGSTEIDDYYWDDIRETIDKLSDLKDDGVYFYHSSW